MSSLFGRKKEWEGINKQTKMKNDLVRGSSRAGWGAGKGKDSSKITPNKNVKSNLGEKNGV